MCFRYKHIFTICWSGSRHWNLLSSTCGEKEQLVWAPLDLLGASPGFWWLAFCSGLTLEPTPPFVQSGPTQSTEGGGTEHVNVPKHLSHTTQATSQGLVFVFPRARF